MQKFSTKELLDWAEGDFKIETDLIVDNRLNAPIYMAKKHLKKDMSEIFGSLGELQVASKTQLSFRFTILVGVDDRHL